MTKSERIEQIRNTLKDLHKARKLGPGAAQWGLEADLEYLLACYDSKCAEYNGLINRPRPGYSSEDETGPDSV